MAKRKIFLILGGLGRPRKSSSQDVLDQLHELFLTRGTPHHIRLDTEAEFTASALRSWLKECRNHTLH